MNDIDIIQTIKIYAVPLLFAITLHEAAHAYVAKYFGDATAYLQGRVSLNPIRHIDPFGTILLPLMLFAIHSPIKIGYAKPVPVDFGKLRKPKRHMAWVALAGPAANLVMAIAWVVFAIFLEHFHSRELVVLFFMKMASAGVQVNLGLFAFNLFPLPPLDGGRILTSFLPNKYAYKFAQIEPYGFFILLGLLYLQVLDYWMYPVISITSKLIDIIISPLSLF